MEIDKAKRRCQAVLERINKLSEITPSSAKSTLSRLANSELNFLSRLSPSSSPLSCNVGYIEAIVHILEQPYITGVSRVCKPIPLSSRKEKVVTPGEAVHVDIVCSLNKNPAWFIVSDRNPKYISWEGCGKQKGLRKRIEQVLDAARAAEALKPSSVVLFFASGIEDAIRENLVEGLGFREFKLDFANFEFAFADTLEGEWVDVIVKSYHGSCSLIIDVDDQQPIAGQRLECLLEVGCSDVEEELDGENSELNLGFSFHSLIMAMKEWPHDDDLSCDEDLINFDTTALIAIVSGISNGASEKLLATPEDELRQRFKINTEFVISQALSEMKNPIHSALSPVLSAKKGIVCEAVHSEFMELVSMCGGSNEQRRADKLVKRLKIVPDIPSQRMMSLPSTRKLALKNKITFGTGDNCKAPTLTANMGFVRAISQTGMSLYTIEHRPRALVGE